MQFSGKFANSSIRFFCCFEAVACVVPFAIQLDASNIQLAFFIKCDALKSRCVVFLHATISMVFRRRSFTKIFPTVIRPIFVYMIDFFSWPGSCHPKPNNSMCKIVMPPNTYFNSALIINRSGGISDMNTFRQHSFPCQASGFWSIIKDTAHKICANIVMRIFVPSFHKPNLPYLAVGFKR
jgi:hypothetical protein